MKLFQKIRESDGRRGFFLKYFSSYLIIFFIPLFLAFFTFHTATHIISAQCSNHVKNVLLQTKDVVDSHLNELKSISLTLKRNEQIIEFHQEWAQPGSTGDIFTAYKVIHSIPKYELINSVVENTRIFFGKPSCCFILGTDNATRYTQNLEGLYWDETTMDLKTLNLYLLNNYLYDQFIIIPSNNSSAQNIYFLSNMDSFYQTDRTTVIIVKLSDQFFSDMLQNITLEECGTSFILTEENELISYYQGKDSFELTDEDLARIIELGMQEHDNNFQYEGNQVNIVRSDFNGWIYYSLIPQTVITQDLTSMRQLIILVTIIVMIVGIFTCYFLTRRNSKPLKNIIKSLTSIYEYGYFDSTDHFKFLENAVSALVDRSSTFHQLLTAEMLRKLFLGESVASNELKEQLAQNPILMEDEPYITVYLHVHNLKKAEKYLSPAQTLINRVKNNFYGPIHSLMIDESNMIFLAIHRTESGKSTFPLYMKDILENLGKEILLETDCHIDFFLSEPMQHYENIHKSYEQCKRIARNVYKKSDLFVYTLEDLPPFQQIYHYTIDQEIQLIQLIQYGSTEKFRAFLDHLYQENFETLVLSEGMEQDLIASIQKSIKRNLSAYQSDEKVRRIFSEFDHENTIEELYNLLHQLKEELQKHISSSAKTNYDNTKQAIIDYMQQNYGNCNLNLSYMCKELEISEQSALKFFQELGSSFSVFLEKIRIEAACAMLSNKELTIKTISEKVGYSSDVSFRRAFKRRLGISPSDFYKNNYTAPRQTNLHQQTKR